MSSKKYICKDISNLRLYKGYYLDKAHEYRDFHNYRRELISEKQVFKLFDNHQAKIISDLNEHEIADNLKNQEAVWYNPYYLKKYQLFIHWYERRYNQYISNENVLINMADYTHLLPSEFNSNKIIKIYTAEESKNFISNNIKSISQSNRFKGFSVYYEVQHEMFPNIENFSFQDFCGSKFLDYLFKIFPNIIGFTSPKIHYIRFTESYLNDDKNEDTFQNGGVEYLNKYSFPTFLPNFGRNNKGEYEKELDLVRLRDRELENCMRIEKGLPKIGEGWISETTLFYEIKNQLPKLEVLHHGRPKWLGLQHFDIWIPSLNVAIEYQGAQHYKPVEFFGGEDAFRMNQKRDKRKKKLCEENKVILIEVREGYDIEEVIQRIKSFI